MRDRPTQLTRTISPPHASVTAKASGREIHSRFTSGITRLSGVRAITKEGFTMTSGLIPILPAIRDLASRAGAAAAIGSGGSIGAAVEIA
jgi:hypothetical protein